MWFTRPYFLLIREILTLQNIPLYGTSDFLPSYAQLSFIWYLAVTLCSLHTLLIGNKTNNIVPSSNFVFHAEVNYMCIICILQYVWYNHALLHHMVLHCPQGIFPLIGPIMYMHCTCFIAGSILLH